MKIAEKAGQNASGSFSFGDLVVTKYFETDRISFGFAALEAGGRGDVDPGHDGAEEVIYVTGGSVVCIFPDNGEEVELSGGEAVLIPEGRPHQLENRGDQPASITYSCAPRL